MNTDENSNNNFLSQFLASLYFLDPSFSTLAALMRACLFGYVNIVKYLLEQDEVKYNLKDILNCTALMSSKTDEIEELFLSKYGILKRKDDLDTSGFEQFKLNRAADHGNLVKVKKYLAGTSAVKN